MRVVLLGPPGSGKGTQGAALAERLGVPVISSGELLRAAAADGRQDLAATLERGELVPDDVVTALVREAVAAERCAGGYLLDGYPRTVQQAERADAPPVDVVVHLDLPDDVARRRLAGRGRADDTDPRVVERRLARYHAETEPLLDLYRRRGILVAVDGDQPPEAVTADILTALGVVA